MPQYCTGNQQRDDVAGERVDTTYVLSPPALVVLNLNARIN